MAANSVKCTAGLFCESTLLGLLVRIMASGQRRGGEREQDRTNHARFRSRSWSRGRRRSARLLGLRPITLLRGCLSNPNGRWHLPRRSRNGEKFRRGRLFKSILADERAFRRSDDNHTQLISLWIEH